ncbi:error-prone DNA polymerase [Schaalia sp. 19OD2882]|uniref:error-prone DNA polymerase n=1 Tax=Schaalia sp. 19OD2882 TaxID=2794089 RepID=UPI001C1EFECA|nr:error-prone DNA polymerase [Schaalia sp. 19OD2882]QWW18734.1 error-prone DNA polymerase [Schaalia sp. 19OD2882]
MHLVPEAEPAYAELHAHSAFTFLDGADQPAALVAEAARLELDALAVLDVDGMYSAVQTQTAARTHALPVVHGAELTLERADLARILPGAGQNGWGLVPGAEDPGIRLPVLTSSPQGRRHLCRAMSEHVLSRPGQRECAHHLADLAAQAHDWTILTGTGRGPLRRALAAGGELDAKRLLDHLISLFGAEHLAIESVLTPTSPPHLADTLAALARRRGLRLVASGAVRCASPSSQALGDVLAATRARADLVGAEKHLPALRAFLRSPREMLALHSRHPQAVAEAAALAATHAFDLRLSAPHLPRTHVPDGHSPASWLRELTEEGARRRYGTRAQNPRAWQVIDHELEVINTLDFPGYFLIVKEIVDFCASRSILCQGRGSAANSAVCYALGITAVDAVRHRLLFERFLSTGRSGPPDIDIDIESGRREEVIQHVYELYGRRRAALVANVISYRPRSAVRDAAKALGYAPDLATQWSKACRRGAEGEEDAVPQHVLSVAAALQRLPRHMGIHPGGMVLTQTPVAEVCPLNWAAMEKHSVLQWDKDDCADAGLVKFDLLGLGMLTALRKAFDALGKIEVRGRDGQPLGLHNLPEEDPRVYDLLCAADTVGVFQVESRAQMNTLPRLRPRCFYDIVVEVALIRPGPIQGHAVNPYLRRRSGREPVTYLHPLLRPALEKTLGVPLFQEQLMQIAIDAAGFTPMMADQLRRAMGSKRSPERMEELRPHLMEGMAARGVGQDVAEKVFDQLLGFADFGFPESHAFSFAHIVYASAWVKVHHPEHFYAALLASQPMGFYSSSSLVHDAKRHGVRIGPVDVQISAVEAEAAPWTGMGEEGRAEECAPVPLDVHLDLCVRVGLASVKGLGEAAERIVEARKEGRFLDVADLARRARLSTREVELLAKAGALASLGMSRREGLWVAGAVGCGDWVQPFIPGTEVGTRAPLLPEMSPAEELVHDHLSMGLTCGDHPIAHVREWLATRQVRRSEELSDIEDGEVVTVAGLVTHRQRPHTGRGITFMSLEDEAGLVNVSCSKDVWAANRRTALSSRALLVRGRIQKGDGAVGVQAHRMWELPMPLPVRSRDFH